MDNFKCLNINETTYIFKSIDELIDMLKEDKYEVILEVKKSVSFVKNTVKL